MRPLLLTLAISLALHTAALGCGPKFFPDCGKPGVVCPPCTGQETFPDPCAARARDAGADR